jgi:SAM-dependent methyltransferase
MRRWIPTLMGLARDRLGLSAGPADRLRPEELNAVLPALHRLSGGLGGGRGKAGAVYLDEARLEAAYLLHFWPISYAMAAAVLAEGWLPKGARALELGCGPGPLTAALLDAGAASVLAVDHSAKALQTVGALLPAARVSTLRWEAESGAPLPEGPYDLLAMSHFINELWKREPDRLARRAAFLGGLAGRLAPGGRLLIIEPAAHALNADLLGLRDRLLRDGWRVEAPCFFQGPCPALALGAACHAEATTPLPPHARQLLTAAHIDRARPGFGWLLLRAPGGEAPAPEAGAVRILSEAMVNKAGRVRRVACGAVGRMTLSAPAAGSEPWRADWQGLRRGERLVVEGAELRERGLGLQPTSRLRRG